MHHFSLVDLQAFSAIADEGNLTRGSQRVHLSPSTVCARIKGLESSLGVSLFTRSAQGMSVTPAGEIVRQCAANIDREINTMLGKLEPYVSRAGGTLRIATNYGSALSFLPNGLAEFFYSHPDLTVSHRRATSQEVVVAISEDKADIGLSAFVGEYPGVEFIDYERDDLVVLVSVNHPLAKYKSIAFSDCLKEDFVSLNEGVEMQRLISGKARELGYKITPKVCVPNQPILFQMVAAGVGIAVASRVVFEAQPNPQVQMVKLTDEWAKRHIRIALPKQKERRIRWALEFADILKKQKRLAGSEKV